MTFKQWILDSVIISECVKQTVSRPDFPPDNCYLDMLVYVDRSDIDPKEFLTLLKLYLHNNVVK